MKKLLWIIVTIVMFPVMVAGAFWLTTKRAFDYGKDLGDKFLNYITD